MKTSNSPSYISCLVVFLGSLILKVVSENFIPQNARTDSFSRFDWDDQRRGPHSIYHRSGREPQTSTVFFPHRLWATIWQVWYEPATEEKVVCPRCKGRRKIYRKTIGCWLCQGSRFFTTQKSLKLAVKRFGDNGNVTEFWLPPDSQKLSSVLTVMSADFLQLWHFVAHQNLKWVIPIPEFCGGINKEPGEGVVSLETAESYQKRKNWLLCYWLSNWNSNMTIKLTRKRKTYLIPVGLWYLAATTVIS